MFAVKIVIVELTHDNKVATLVNLGNQSAVHHA